MFFLEMRIVLEFSTLNESSLHHSLKILYSEIYDGKTEVNQDGHIYDIVTKNGNIIEIQTKNLTKLLPKILDSIEKGHNVKIIHPIIITNTIELYDDKENLLSKRKSSKKGSIYDIFGEITGLYPVLLNPHFSLEVVEIKMTEKRIKTASPVQSKNGRRRFKKDWLKVDKKLDEIITTRRFNTENDYLSLLPPTLPQEFSAKDLKNCLAACKTIPARIYNNSNLILWVLSHMELIQESKRVSNLRYYKIKKSH